MITPFTKKKYTERFPVKMRKQDSVHFQSILSYNCPDLVIYEFKTVNLLPDGTLFKGIFPLKLSFLFFKKRLALHSIKGIIDIKRTWTPVQLCAGGPYVVIHDPWTKNYYHWITQALPRLLLIQQTNKPFTLILPEDHQSDFHRASLKLLNIESWYIIENGKKYCQVNNLWYPTHDVQIGDYHADLMTSLRRRIRGSTVLQAPFKKIFISRVSRGARCIINEEAVHQVFLSFGFEIVEFERLLFEQQVLLLNRTRVLAGVHGAGLTNMIFMPDHSTIFELTTKVNGENYYYFTLSNVLEHKYYYQVCNTNNESAAVQEANLLVDLNELKQNIKHMLES